MNVLVVAAGPAGESVSECGCCGLRYPVKRTVLWLCDGDALYGEICPDCILRGPRGAARLLGARLRESAAGSPGAVPAASGADIRAWRRRMARKTAALEVMASFSLEARQAAVRELRERR